MGIVTGGGSGHLPLFKGYVGHGLCTGGGDRQRLLARPRPSSATRPPRPSTAAPACSTSTATTAATCFNFDLAGDLAELDGIETRTVLGADDVASQPKERASDRRGVAGIFFAYKVAGAAAERGDSLDEVAAHRPGRRRHTRRRWASGCRRRSCPTAGKPTFELPDGEMEIGIGIHGEPGIHRGPLETADEIAVRLITPLIEDLGLAAG